MGVQTVKSNPPGCRNLQPGGSLRALLAVKPDCPPGCWSIRKWRGNTCLLQGPQGIMSRGTRPAVDRWALVPAGKGHVDDRRATSLL
ncbi:MAG: hypothetical protein CMJ81_01815 [Planctomycetaceae bacterium]|nr:hypothetical protein [Planctomycetaceae bacterium]